MGTWIAGLATAASLLVTSLAPLGSIAVVATSAAVSPNFTFFSLPGRSSPRFVERGADGSIWFATDRGMGRVTPAGRIIEYAAPAGEPIFEVGGITAGPLGRIWFTDDRLSIGWIAPSGAMGEFPLPQTVGYGRLGGIAAGRDGNLWFTEVDLGRIGRMSPTGTIHEFSVRGTPPTDIQATSNGTVWFASSYDNMVGTIDGNGRVRTYRLPRTFAWGGGGPQAIAADAKGNLWFSMPNTGGEGGGPGSLPEGGGIGRIDWAGHVLLFPTQGMYPSCIAVDHQANVWFGSFRRNVLGRMTANGTLESYALPGKESTVTDLTVGGDGSIWFADMENNRIGRFRPSQ